MITRVLPCFSFTLIVTGYSLMLAASGQTPIATPLPPRTVPLSDSDAVHGVRLQTEVDAAKAVVDRLARRQAVIQRYARQVYRKPTQEELKRVAPDAEILEQYRSLLSQSGTGIFKLVPYNDCGDGSMTVSTLPGCSSLAMPGKGSSFSFREGTYHISRLADLRQDGPVLKAAGSRSTAALAELRNEGIEAVTLTSPVVRLLPRLKPTTDWQTSSDSNTTFE